MEDLFATLVGYIDGLVDILNRLVSALEAFFKEAPKSGN